MRLSAIIKGLVAILVVFVVAIGAILHSTDFNHYKSEVSELVHALTDRRLTIKGEFRASFGLKPAIAVDRVTFSNAKWGSRRDMMRIKRLRAELELLPLLFGEIRIKRIVLTGADILLETRADGLGNWVLQPSVKDTDELPILPTFDRVLIENAVMAWRDSRTGSRTDVKIHRLRTSADSAGSPLDLDLKGSYNGEAVRLTGQIDSLGSLTANKPTAIRLKLRTGGAQVEAAGKIREPISGANLKVAVSAIGKNLATLSGLFGTALPSIGPYNVRAVVVDKKSRWHLQQVKAKIGKSDLAGDIYIDPNTAPVRLFAKLQGDLVRVSDFEDKGGSARSNKKKRRIAKTRAAERLFSGERLSFSGLEDLSARISLKAERILIDEYLFEKASLTAAIRKNRLTLRPAKARFEGGDVTLDFDLSEVKRRLRVRLKADARRVNLARLLKKLGYPDLAIGHVNANSSLSGSGTSLRTLMAGLNGHFVTTMKGGRINNRNFTRLSGETLAAILPWSSGDKGIAVKCLVGQYQIRRGRLVSNVTILDTDRLLVKGEGGIDLGKEIIDFTITPRAKEASLVNLLVPIKIDGKLADPEVYADPAGVAKNALGFATGGILANGLVSEIIGSIVAGLSGEEETSPCLAAITEIRGSSGRKDKGKRAKDDGDTVLESIGEGLRNLFSR